MAYGILKCDTVTFTNAGVDKSVTLSGLVQNPTFSGNVTVTGTLSGVTVTGTTANFTSGNFTNISGGTHTITSGVFAAGSEASPSITFIGNLNTGIYSPGADQVAISTGGSGRLFINSDGTISVGAVVTGDGGVVVFNASGQTTANLSTSTNNGSFIVARHNNANSGAGGAFVVGAQGGSFAAIKGLLTDGSNNTAGDLAFSTRATSAASTLSERLRITSAGLVGVGTSSPGYKLDVQGAAASAIVGAQVLNTDPSGYSNLILRNSGGTAQEYQLVVGGSTSASAKNFWLYDATAGAVRLHVSSAGNVGIGTTSPGASLDVNGSALLANSSFLGFGNADALIQGSSASGANFLMFRTNLNERARIDHAGRLLVGTSTARDNFFNTTGIAPQIQLEGNAVGSRVLSIISSDSTVTRGGALLLGHQKSGTIGGNTALGGTDSIGFITFQGSDGSEFVEGAKIEAIIDGGVAANDLPTALVFSTTADGASSPTERVRIGNAGKIEINLNSAGLYIANWDTGAGSSTVKYNTTTGQLTYDTSSRLVKENIENCPYGINELKQLKPRKYFRADDQRTEIGFIADEVIDLMPEFVPIGAKSIITKDASDTELIPVGVNYDKLTAVLTKALQEAVTKIESLEARLTAAGI